jgi:hypothetical protein
MKALSDAFGVECQQSRNTCLLNRVDALERRATVWHVTTW